MRIRIIFLTIIFCISLSGISQTDTSKVYTHNGRQIRYLTVEKGRTLYNISKTYGIPQDTIISLNPVLEYGLKAGMVIRIPVKMIEKNIDPRLPINQPFPADTISKKINPDKINQVKKEKIPCADTNTREIRIGLFLPFNINLSTKITSKTKIALDFYNGVKLASDSLEKHGVKAKVYVYDTKSDSSELHDILKKQECERLDIIIGPLYSSTFKPVSRFAKEHGIAIVSPFSQNKSIIESNPFSVKVTPDEETIAKELCRRVVEKKGMVNYILLRNSNSHDKVSADLIAGTFREMTGKKIKFSEASYSNIPNLIKSLDNVQENVIFFPSTEQLQVLDFLEKLHAQSGDKKIAVIGKDEWLDYEDMELDHLNNLHFIYPSTLFPDCQSYRNINFCRDYEKNYNEQPGKYAFQGFDIMYYFTLATFKYGRDLIKCLDKMPKNCGLGVCFEFRKNKPENGFENKFVQIMQIEDFLPSPLK